MLHKLALFALLFLTYGLLNITAQTPTPTPTDGIATTSGLTKEKTISKGVVNGSALSLAKPVYPPAAKAVRASGAVNVQVLIDENGNVVNATAVSGHPLLRQASVQAARQSTFKPTLLSGQPVKVNGIIVYNFVPPISWAEIGSYLGEMETGEIDAPKLNNIGYTLPLGFEAENERIGDFLKSLKSNEINDANSKKREISGIIEAIQTRVLSQPDDAWEFNLSLTLTRIKNNLADDVLLRSNLLKIQDLVNSAPDNISEVRVNNLKKLSEFVNKINYTQKDREEIMNLLNY